MNTTLNFVFYSFLFFKARLLLLMICEPSCLFDLYTLKLLFFFTQQERKLCLIFFLFQSPENNEGSATAPTKGYNS